MVIEKGDGHGDTLEDSQTSDQEQPDPAVLKRREYQRKRYHQNPTPILEKNRRWRQQNPAKARARVVVNGLNGTLRKWLRQAVGRLLRTFKKSVSGSTNKGVSNADRRKRLHRLLRNQLIYRPLIRFGIGFPTRSPRNKPLSDNVVHSRGTTLDDRPIFLFSYITYALSIKKNRWTGLSPKARYLLFSKRGERSQGLVHFGAIAEKWIGVKRRPLTSEGR